MTVLDKHSHVLEPGSEIVVHGNVGTVLEFIDEEPPFGVFSGQYTGQLRVLVDGEEESYPTYAADHYNVCWDLAETEYDEETGERI